MNWLEIFSDKYAPYGVFGFFSIHTHAIKQHGDLPPRR
jgi:hypothetical protein